MNFTENILALLEQKGISKNKMLKDLGMGTGTFATWQKRGTIPNGETLLKIASYFNVSIDYLLGNEQKEKPATDSDRLTEEEKKIIDLLRKVPEEDRKMLVGMIEGALRSRGLLK
jgi:transcriptional regulator with XRE-family HTH domain